MKDIFLKGKKVSLTVLTVKDINESNWYKWFNDTETTLYMQQGYFPNTKSNQLRFLKELKNQKNKVQLGILPNNAKNIVGVVSLSEIDFLNRKAEFSIIIGEKKLRGVGIGKEATQLILRHGFQKLCLNKIYLGVLAEHKAAIKSYENAGFKIEGLLRDEVLMYRKYHDIVRMGILYKDFEKYNK